MNKSTISISGGGIAGLATAIALKNIGVECSIFEASNQMLPLGAGLGLGINAMMAFRELGIYENIIRAGKALQSFTVFDQSGKPISKTSFNSTDSIGNFTIHRAKLHEVLLSEIEHSSVHTGKRIKDIEISGIGIKLFFEDGSFHHTDYLIAADGINSRIRKKLLPQVSPRYSGYTCWRAVVDGHSLNINETSETWGANGRFGIVPLSENSVYWFACINAKPFDPVMSEYKTKDLYKRFKDFHSPIPEILRLTEDKDLIHNDISDIKPLNKFSFGRIVLIGDAAHATTPNMGQGACQAIEDAVVLAQCIADNSDFETAFKMFEKCRLKRTKWITDTSRKVGLIAQLENPLLIRLRNAALRLMPFSAGERQLRELGKTDFKISV